MKRCPWLLLAVVLSLVFSACIKRIPASAGPDRTLAAGAVVGLGQARPLPEGTAVLWRLGDGRTREGARVEAVWDRPGAFVVQVQVTDSDGEKRSDSARIEVVRPALLQVLPADCGYLVLFDKPPTGLGELPLFLERLLSSGQDVNRVLAGIRDGFGFDPMTEEGMRAAGFDPEGGLAMAGLADGRDPVLVASLLPGEAVDESVRRMVARMGEAQAQPNQTDQRVFEVRDTKKGGLRLAYTYHRGHLWVAAPGDAGRSPVDALVALRRSPAGPSLAESPLYLQALKRNPQPGAVRLFVTPAFMRRAQEEELARASSADRRAQAALLERLRFLRGDLRFADDGARLVLRVGLAGEGLAALRQAFRSHRPMPPFRGMIADGQHLVVKVSVEWAALLEQILTLAGEPQKWEQLKAAMDELAARSGIMLRQGLLDNLGDACMLNLRIKLAGLPGLASGDGQKKPSLEDLLEGVVLFQVSNAALLAGTLDGLAGLDAGGEHLAGFEEDGHRFSRLGPAQAGFVIGVAGRLAVIGTSTRTVTRALDRGANPGPPDARWPASMDRAETQVAVLDLKRLLADFEKVQVPVDNPTAALIKGMIATYLQRIGQLRKLVIEMVLHGDELTTSVHLDLHE